jgi:hypothetical protein
VPHLLLGKNKMSNQVLTQEKLEYIGVRMETNSRKSIAGWLFKVLSQNLQFTTQKKIFQTIPT